jgi:branched-chain amino acid transport system substrate-binding protein
VRRRSIVYALILCLLLAGCRSYRAIGASTLSSLLGKAILVPHSTRPVIKIGLVAPFEGRYRSLGYEALYAVKLAVRERNAAGGVAGHMVELVALDDGDDADASSVQALKFGVDERVMGVIGPFSQAAARAAAPVYQNLGLPAITPLSCGLMFHRRMKHPASNPLAAQQPSSGDRALFCLGADEEALSRALVERLPGGAQVTLLRAGLGELGDSLCPAAGHVQEAPRGEAAFAALREHRADVYLFDGDVLAAADFLVKARRAGIDAPLWGGPSLARTQLAQIAGDAVAGTCHALTASAWADLSPAGGFVAGYGELSGTTPGPWAALAYDAAHLLLDAIERTIQADGAPTREGVTAALAQARDAGGQPLFEQGRRREAEIVFYCYEPGDAYPGTIQRQAEPVKEGKQ